MPDLVIPLTDTQATRITAAFPPKDGLTSVQRVRLYLKQELRRAVLAAEMTTIRSEHDLDTETRLALVEADLRE